MALSAEFSLLHSELNDFLFAQIGEEESGAPLSVLSALTRLGTDPWAEGARLSDLPKDVAARALVPVIVMFPKEKRNSSDVAKLAERLAALLPQRAPPRPSGGPAAETHRSAGSPAFWLLALGLLLVLFGMGAYGLLPGQ
jgi:hypothetical protein